MPNDKASDAKNHHEFDSDLHMPKMPERMMVEGETASSYAAFKVYFNLGDNRTVPAVCKAVKKQPKIVYGWCKKYRWDERIDAANGAVLAAYQRETEKQAIRYAAQYARRKQELTSRQYEIIEAFQAKALEVIRFVVVKDVQTNQDGKTIIIKSNPNVRLADAVRLLLGGNVALSQVDQIFNGRKLGGGKTSQQPDGSRSPVIGDGPLLEVFLDGGDGVPQPVSAMSPHDRLDPNFHPDVEDEPEPPSAQAS